MTNKILLPVDFSDNSLIACRYALIIAQKTNSSILLFHAYYSPAFDLIEMTVNQSTRKKLKEDVEQNLLLQVTPQMNNFIEKMMKLHELKGFKKENIESLIRAGTPIEEIPVIAKEYQPDLIIMGTHSKDDAAYNLLGSITKFAINKLTFPVLAIPPISDIQNIELSSAVYLTDFDETDFYSIKKLLDLTENLNLNIHCVHIGGGIPERKILKMEGLIDYFKKAYSKFSIDYHLVSVNDKTNLLTSVEKYVKANNINLISLTRKKRNILKKYLKPSLTNKLFHRIKLPLLVFQS